MGKRFIFDLDGTLLTGDYSSVNKYFKEKYGDRAGEFLANISEILDRYEKTYPKYDYEFLSDYLEIKTGLPFTPEIIKEWDQLVGDVPSTLEEGAVDTLKDLKESGVSLVVLTNWFGESQEKRLEKAGLLEYIETVYGGDIVTKPHKEAYWIASAQYKPEDCYFIGDSIDNDYIGPRCVGMNSIIYDKENVHHKSLIKVRRLEDLKKFK